MKFLPYEHYNLVSSLSSGEVAQRLRENIISTSRPISYSTIKITRGYRGFLKGNQFEISRITSYSNSFSPIIKGRIFDNHGASTIDVKMSMHNGVSFLVIVWMIGVTIALAATINEIVNTKKFSPIIFVVIAMYLFGYGLSVGSFKYECAKSKKILADLL